LFFFWCRTEKEIEEENREIKDANIISSERERERENERSIDRSQLSRAKTKSMMIITRVRKLGADICGEHHGALVTNRARRGREEFSGGVVATRVMKSCPLLAAMKLDL
jgi:hypothetical protein